MNVMAETDGRKPGRRRPLARTVLGTLGGALAGFGFYMLLGCTAGGG